MQLNTTILQWLLSSQGECDQIFRWIVLYIDSWTPLNDTHSQLSSQAGDHLGRTWHGNEIWKIFVITSSVFNSFDKLLLDRSGEVTFSDFRVCLSKKGTPGEMGQALVFSKVILASKNSDHTPHSGFQSASIWGAYCKIPMPRFWVMAPLEPIF